ncbi:hypothetical protein BBC0178_017690 [Bartonella apihabitans]|uniref:Uncharacterized protein n=1 Tax=Bartonella apihabitans TaxID=2750929 RepID=A0A1U9MCQ7_9HYPH|nr:hypothetical protein [Bartonella apihabitans]AQT43221.1 hypothetical protein BBC0178_017690 [Bartonella apihabitans]
MLVSKEKAARSSVKHEKEIERLVLGNEGMAVRSSVEFKKETLENVLESKEKAVTLSAGFGKQALQKVTDLKEKAARSRVKREKEVVQQVLGNDKKAGHSSGAVERKTVQAGDDGNGKLPLESNAVLKTMPTEKSLTKKKAAQKKREAVGEKKASGILKEAILKAAIKAGNQLGEDGLVSYLEAQALKNASSFLTLLGKVLPAELNSDGQELKTVTKIELVALSPSPKDLTVAKSPTGKKRAVCKKHMSRNQKPEINQELSEILKKDD